MILEDFQAYFWLLGLTLELVTHLFITISMCISMYYDSIFILEYKLNIKT